MPSRPLDVQLVHAGSRAPTDAQCRATMGIPCYSPQEIEHALRRGPAPGPRRRGCGRDDRHRRLLREPDDHLRPRELRRGLRLAGAAVVHDPLATRYGAVQPDAIPDQVGWAAETTLDVEWSHAMAPNASIVLMTGPVDETEGVQGLPQFN